MIPTISFFRCMVLLEKPYPTSFCFAQRKSLGKHQTVKSKSLVFFKLSTVSWSVCLGLRIGRKRLPILKLMVFRRRALRPVFPQTWRWDCYRFPGPLAILMPLLLFLCGLSDAGVAQLVEHLICNQRVGGSIPSASSTRSYWGERGRSESSQEKRTGWCLLTRVLFVFLRGMPASC